MTRSRRRLLTGGAVLAVAALAVQLPATASSKGSPDDLTAGERDALAAGLQLAPKGAQAKGDAAGLGPNPFIANLPDLTGVDYAGWKARMKSGSLQRAASSDLRSVRAAEQQRTAAADSAVVWDEQEPAGTAGSNDTLASAEPIPVFGTAARKNSVLRILGEQAVIPAPTPRALAPVAEDNGAIPIAGATGIAGRGAVTTSGVLGDGPHGTAGTGTNDFDFYRLDVTPGFTVVADTSGSPTGTDTVIALYTADGTLVASDDDGGTTGLASRLVATSEAGGTHYLAVAGFTSRGSLPRDPFDPTSGNGNGDTGDYVLALTSKQVDSDNYAVQLRPGDVVGGVGYQAANALTVFRPDGTQMVGGAGTDASFLYPPESPLPGGGNTTVAYVAEEAGWYVLRVGGVDGAYQVQLEGYRPGAETDRNRTQTVFLDFEGGRVNTAIWSDTGGVRELSPFGSFLAKWGIPRARERAMIDAITAEVEDNLEAEVAAGGLNRGLQVRVVNSRTNPGVEGRTNVSRVVVGGTIAESGISTIGIAEYIDPGNWAHEDSSLVLLDVLSNPSGPASLNTYLRAESDREAFVAQAVGNVIAHEVGHTVGSYHTDNLSEVFNLMDAGGTGFQNLFGVGPDGVGGTADDDDVAFEEDRYIPSEGFTGLEDTQNVTAWAYPGRR